MHRAYLARIASMPSLRSALDSVTLTRILPSMLGHETLRPRPSRRPRRQIHPARPAPGLPEILLPQSLSPGLELRQLPGVPKLRDLPQGGLERPGVDMPACEQAQAFFVLLQVPLRREIVAPRGVICIHALYLPRDGGEALSGQRAVVHHADYGG